MTGKELIIYILENDLLDEEMISVSGAPAWLMTAGEAAAKFNVGIETIRVWVTQNRLDGVLIGEEFYIYKNAKDPRI